ncbi:MAG: CoA-disulfide reductase [Candidatus Izemoplasmatales bacterium]
MSKKKVLIIGGVAGGASTAARLRRLDEHAEIIMFERGEYISFANCGLPYYIGGVISSRDSLLVQTVEDMQNKYNIDVRIFSEVTNIDPSAKKVTVTNVNTGESYEETYDSIVISTGAYPVKPPIPGINDAKNLFTLRNIPDTDAIKTYIETFNPKRATVIGAGFIGIEMAENLSHLGIKVTIVEMANQIMAPIDYELAQILHQHVRDQNVTLILNDGVKSFEDDGKQIHLSSGKVIHSDLIIFAIGVRSENILAKKAGLAIGERGGIKVDNHLRTTDPSIYAIGDAIEVTDFVTKTETMIPLAGPANKQGRIAAGNIAGRDEVYEGTMGTSVAKVFDYTVGSTGNNEKTLKKSHINYKVIHLHPGSHAGYYPGAATISMKVIYNTDNLEILGAQAVGLEGIDKRIDVIATAIKARMKVTDLKDLELSYAPPFSSAKDPVNMVGYIAENIIEGLVETIDLSLVDELVKRGEFILDVREEIENELGTINGSVNIPFPQIRSRLNELPKDKKIYVFCQAGLRGYAVCRILNQHGFHAINLDGGYKTYQCVNDNVEYSECGKNVDDSGSLNIKELHLKEENKLPAATVSVDACGLQCPGPIVMVYKTLAGMNDGDVLEIKASDPGFMKDIRNWTEKTKNTLLEVKKEDKTIYATIKKGNADLSQNKDVIVTEQKNGSTIVVFSQDLDKAIAAFIIAQGALAMGKEVSMFFTFWGLNILRKTKKTKVKKLFIEKMFGWMMPRGTEKLPISNMNMLGMGPKMIKSIMKKKNVDSLQLLMQNAQKLGVKITACAMSMDIMGIHKEELIDGIEIAGVASYLSDTTDANHNLFI